MKYDSNGRRIIKPMEIDNYGRKTVQVSVTNGNKSNQLGDAMPYIQISDSQSGIQMGEINFDPADFGEMLAGNGYVQASMTLVSDKGWQNIGKKNETERLMVPKSIVKPFDGRPERDEAGARRAIADYIDENGLWPEGEGWYVSSSGMGSQQHTPDKQQVVVRRYVDVTENTTGE